MVCGSEKRTWSRPQFKGGWFKPPRLQRTAGYHGVINSSSASSQAITALAWHNKKCIKGHWMKQTVMQYRTIASPMLCVCCSDGGGLIKSSEMCVMLHVSTWWQSKAQHSDPLNRAPLLSASLLPPIPSLHSSFPFCLSFTSCYFLPPFLLFFDLLHLLLLLSSFCSFVLLWHIPQACWGEGRGKNRRGEDGKEKKKGGGAS